MVNIFSSADKKTLSDAIIAVEKHTQVELVVTVAKASDHYFGFILLYGFTLASFIDLGLWMEKIVVPFPMLLTVQLAIPFFMLMLTLTPLHNFCVRLVPHKIRNRHAAHRAYEEYIGLAHHLPPHVPLILLYISLAERCVYIISSRKVREKIHANALDHAIATFTASQKTNGLLAACLLAISHIRQTVAPHFPRTDTYANHLEAVREIP